MPERETIRNRGRAASFWDGQLRFIIYRPRPVNLRGKAQDLGRTGAVTFVLAGGSLPARATDQGGQPNDHRVGLIAV